MSTLFGATKEAIRERILAELERMYKTQEQVNDYTYHWENVIRSPLLEGQKRKNFELAIIDHSEIKDPQIQCAVAILSVDLEWSALGSQNDVPSQLANVVILGLERRLNENIYLFENNDNVNGQQLALRAWTTGNEYTISNDTDRRIEGVMFVKIEYKHLIADPRRQIQ